MEYATTLQMAILVAGATFWHASSNIYKVSYSKRKFATPWVDGREHQLLEQVREKGLCFSANTLNSGRLSGGSFRGLLQMQNAWTTEKHEKTTSGKWTGLAENWFERLVDILATEKYLTRVS